jgi:hypothetical protein
MYSVIICIFLKKLPDDGLSGLKHVVSRIMEHFVGFKVLTAVVMKSFTLPLFRRNMSPPSSRSKIKPSKKPRWKHVASRADYIGNRREIADSKSVPVGSPVEQNEQPGPGWLPGSCLLLVRSVVSESQWVLTVHSVLRASQQELSCCLQFPTCFLYNPLCLPHAFSLVSCLAWSSNLKMEVTCFSEKSLYFQRNTRRYIPKDKIKSSVWRCPLHFYIHTTERRTANDELELETKWSWPKAGTILVFAWRNWRTPWETSVKIAGVSAEIRTEHLLSKKS